jgi:hypothetical protein
MGPSRNVAQRRFGWVVRLAPFVRILVLIAVLVVVLKVLGVW